MAFKSVKKLVAGKIIILTASTVLSFSFSAYSQYEYPQAQQQEEEPLIPSENIQQERPYVPENNTWQNSTQPSASDIRSQQEELTIKPSTNSNNVQGRPAAGGGLGDSASVDGRDPAGNPDVPFDENMNMAFLITSLACVLGFVLFRKRFKLSPVNTKTK